jgi:hypothetical protein
MTTSFTVHVTATDIAAAHRGNPWDDPIRRALMRMFPEALNAVVGWGYASVYYEEEIHDFSVASADVKRETQYLKDWQSYTAVGEIDVVIWLDKVKEKKGTLNIPTTPARYLAPKKVAKTGM